jgi:superfamily I DNA/RNA helicase
MTPTVQQTAFLDALTGSTSNLALVARAGCGKTSTILLGVDAVRRANPRAEVLVCAFNKAIATEVAEKLKKAGHDDWRSVQASTLHGLGFGLLKYAFKPKVNEKKVEALVDEAASISNIEVYSTYRAQIISLVRYAKQAGFGFFSDLPVNDDRPWFDLADHFDVNGLDDTSEAADVVAAARSIYRASLAQTDVVDFDDMILFPLVKNLTVKFGKDIVFLDEAQDLSRARQALARKFVKRNGGRMIVVGDDRQAIYGFSGADAAALPNLIESLDATVLPLSVTWRCPKAVVEVAKTLVPDIEAAPEAPEGKVSRVTKLPDDLKAGDAILCRNTAPLVKTAYALIRSGKPAKVEGRAIGDGLKALAGRWKVSTVSALLNKLDDYREREIQKAMAKGNDAKAEEVEDRVGTLVEVCNAVIASGKTGVADVREFIDRLFADDAKGAIVLATYHRSKGREWPRVYLFEHSSRCPSKAAKKAWALLQEHNLYYVAVTRAQEELVFVE